MDVTKLEIYNFRNYNQLILDNLKKINIIIGKNGIGKTSIIEAIYLCSISKSFRTNHDNILIKENELYYKIKNQILNNKTNKQKNLEIFYSLTSGKKTKVNSKIEKKISNFIAKYNVILFSPDELKIIKDSPITRRNYLNIQISQIDKKYLNILNQYNIIIKNKNNYLKKMYINKNYDSKYIDILDEKLVLLGTEIYNYRNDYINEINTNINQIFQKFKKNEEIKLIYKSDFSLDITKNIKKLKQNREKEIILGMTKTGIHKDDIEFIYNDKLAKEYSSQGIQKLILLSLKFSELEIFINKYNIYPILLLDDLFSELDEENQNKILRYLTKQTQIFITTTDLNNISEKLKNKANIINIDGGI